MTYNSKWYNPVSTADYDYWHWPDDTTPSGNDTYTWTWNYLSKFCFCPNCGRKTRTEENYCPECGRYLYEYTVYPYQPYPTWEYYRTTVTT